MNITIKLIIFFGGLLLGMTVFAQTRDSFFEGTVRYKIEFQGPNAEMIKRNEPNDKMTIHIKDADYIVQLGGGMYPKTFLFIADSNYQFSIDMSNRLAYRYSAHSDMAKPQKEVASIQAKPTGGTLELKGIQCQEYRMVKDGTEFLYYVNDDYRVDAGAYPSDTRSKASWLAPGLEGRIPLRTIKKQKGLSVLTDLVSIGSSSFALDQFRIPPGFKVKGRDYRY
ncbi:MAG: hypothetical protein AAF135_06470 [Bacteroidota bacterium]